MLSGARDSRLAEPVAARYTRPQPVLHAPRRRLTTRHLRHRPAAWRRRHGRCLSRPRSQTRTSRRDQGALRRALDRPDPDCAVRAGSARRLRPQPSECLRGARAGRDPGWGAVHRDGVHRGADAAADAAGAATVVARGPRHCDSSRRRRRRRARARDRPSRPEAGKRARAAGRAREGRGLRSRETVGAVCRRNSPRRRARWCARPMAS